MLSQHLPGQAICPLKILAQRKVFVCLSGDFIYCSKTFGTSWLVWDMFWFFYFFFNVNARDLVGSFIRSDVQVFQLQM